MTFSYYCYLRSLKKTAKIQKWKQHETCHKQVKRKTAQQKTLGMNNERTTWMATPSVTLKRLSKPHPRWWTRWTAVDDADGGYGDCWKDDVDTGTAAVDGCWPKPVTVCCLRPEKIPPRRTNRTVPCSPGGAVATGQRTPACSPVQMTPPNYRRKWLEWNGERERKGSPRLVNAVKWLNPMR